MFVFVIHSHQDPYDFPVSKKPREYFKPWVPNSQEATVLEGAEAISCQREISRRMDAE